MPKSLKRIKAEEAVTKFPNTASKAIARVLVKENPALFANSEEARLDVRKARGSAGKGNKKQALPGAITPSSIVYNPYALPAETHHDNKYYQLTPTKDTIIGLLSDIHIPYQHNQALTTALDECKRQKITHLVLNGDIMDCYQISSFAKDPSMRSFPEELEAVRNFLKVLAEKFKGVKIIYKGGNHEHRFLRFMRSKAPELLGIEVFALNKLLHLDKLGIDYVPDNKLIQCGHLMIIHGHEFGQQIFSPVNPARGYFLKAKTNVIGGHNHQVSAHSENRIDGKQMVAYSTGHLADPSPEYKPVNNWSHGAATIKHVEDNGEINFVIHNYKIINGRIY